MMVPEGRRQAAGADADGRDAFLRGQLAISFLRHILYNTSISCSRAPFIRRDKFKCVFLARLRT
jgi:hypothetical protein